MIRELLSAESIVLDLPLAPLTAIERLTERLIERPVGKRLDSDDQRSSLRQLLPANIVQTLLASLDRPGGTGDRAYFPHAAIPGIRSPRLMIGRLSPGAGQDDAGDCRFMALLLVPEEDPERMLLLLERLAALIPALVPELSRMRSADAILQRLISAEAEARGPTYFNMTDADLAAELVTDRLRGLSEGEARRRLERYGRNVLRPPARTPLWMRLIRNFFSFFALLLWAAGILCFIPGVDMPQLGWAILVVIVINGIFSFLQETRADRAVETLQRLLTRKALVLRDGEEREVDAELIVPGDIVLLEEGDAVPADARLIEASGIEVNNSSLTGESASVKRYKSDRPVLIDKPFLWIEMPNVLFAGSSLIKGRGRAIVIGTGMNTEIGRIAGMTQSIRGEDTPLQKQLRETVATITLLAALFGAVFLLLGWQMAGLTFIQAFIFCIGLFVANVPEGLLPTVTLALALGVQRMAKRNAIVKNLSSVETLGCTTVICTDKTGTLTENVMSVVEVYAAGEIFEVEGSGYAPIGRFLKDGSEIPVTRLHENLAFNELSRCARLCNNARLTRNKSGDDLQEWHLSGDPTEGALLCLSMKAGIEAQNDRIHLFPFESVRKRMSVVVQTEQGPTIYAKGAPLELLACCAHIQSASGVVPLETTHVEQIRSINDRWAQRGLRVLALACRVDEEGVEYTEESAESGLVFLGLTAMQDPLRQEVPDAIRACHEAGIRIVMITGDYAGTARSIGLQAGMRLPDDQPVFSGTEIGELAEERLRDLLRQSDRVFARVSPEQKLRIVSCLRDLGEIVAVTGDGVNDAPALKKAHIGIAMGGRGSDVAREAAHMVLADDNFSKIVHAIEEGRAIFRNIRRFIAYVLNSNPQEMIPYILWMLFPGTPLAMTVMGVLAIDVGTDLVPAMGLGIEPPEKNVMKQPPRSRSEKMLSLPMVLKSYFIRGSILTIGCYITYLFFGWIEGYARDSSSLLSLLKAMPASPANLEMNEASQPYLMSLSAFFLGTVFTQIANVLCKRSNESLFSRDFLSEERRARALKSLRHGRFRTGLRLEMRLRAITSAFLGRHWFVMNLVSNPLITAGIVFEILFALIVIYSPLNRLYYFAPVGWPVFLAALSGPALLLAFEETRKYLLRRGRKYSLLEE